MRASDANANPVGPESGKAGWFTSTQLSDAILRSTVFMVIASDEGGNVMFFNAGAEKALGYKAEEVIGKLSPTIWHDAEEIRSYAMHLSQQFGEAMQPDHEVFVKITRLFGAEEKEWTFIRKDGSRFPGLVSLDGLRDAEGRIIGFLAIIKDISERDRVRVEREDLIEQLTESNAEFERFAYVASHDMQEPLRAMSSFSDIIVSEYHDIIDDDGKLYLKLIRDAAARMQTMVVDLLEYARVGKERPQHEMFDASEEYTHVLENLATLIDGQKAQISSDSLPRIKGTAVQFSRLLQNLIGNGLKYRRPEDTTKIAVHVADKGDAWQFSVADNGIGIDAKNLVKIFEPFKRLHNRQKYAGTGLGLSVCKKIVEHHAGKIWCDSIEGQGSTFYFTWPK